jgi:hypothetical protein
MITVVPHICWQISSVTPSYDDLLGLIWGLPVNFEFQLVGFDEPRRFGQVTELSEKKNETVCAGVEVLETAVRSGLDASLDGAPHEDHRVVAVPMLRTRRSWYEREYRYSKEPEVFHFRPISLSHSAAATTALALLLSSCSDLALPSAEILSIADLLILSQQPNAPEPASESFWVSNSRQSVARINHADNFNTLYLELAFPAQSLASLNGAPLSDTDSVYVTINPRPGSYGFTLSPSGIAFNSGSSPFATFSFSVYGNATAGNTSGTYAGSTEYVAALEIWREVTVDQWQIASGSGSAGVDGVRANVESSGRFVLAAPR